MKNYFLFSLLIAGNILSAQDAWRKIGNIAPEAGYNFSTSIAIDSNNVLYVAYADLGVAGSSTYFGATVKKFDGTDWLPVGPRTYTGSVTANGTEIAVNKQGIPYLVYSINPVGSYFSNLRLDKFNGTSWDNISQVSGSINIWSALTIDRNNDPFFAYNNNAGINFNMAASTTGSLGGFNMGLVGYQPDFAVDKNNNIYMAYRGTSNLVYVQRFNGTTWEFVGPSTLLSPSNCTTPRIALDKNNVLYLVYRDQNRETIDVKRFNGTDWELVGSAGFAGKVEYPDIAIDHNNVPYVSYNDLMGGNTSHPNYYGLAVQKFNGTSWELVGQRGFTSKSFNTHLVIGKNNIPYIGTESNYPTGWKAEAYYFGPPTYPAILPVHLRSFDVKVKQNGVEATWTTASELNNNYFILERSKDSKGFSEVSRIKGAGNSSSTLHYSNTDNDPVIGRSYYRLKQVDLDGNYSYSTIKSVIIRGNQQVQIFPSNTGGVHMVNIPRPTPSMRIEVYEMQGRLLYSTTTVSKSNTLSLNNFAKGMYVIKVIDGNQTMMAQKVMR